MKWVAWLTTLASILLIVHGVRAILAFNAAQKPHVVTYDQFVKARPTEGWYRVTGCYIDLTDSTYLFWRKPDGEPQQDVNGDPILTDVYVPVRSVAKQEEKKVPVAFLTHNEKVYDLIRQLDKLDRTKATEKQVEKWMIDNRESLFVERDIEGAVQSGWLTEDDRTRAGKENDVLSPGFVTLEDGARPAVPGLRVVEIALGAGLAVLALISWAIYLALSRYRASFGAHPPVSRPPGAAPPIYPPQG